MDRVRCEASGLGRTHVRGPAASKGTAELAESVSAQGKVLSVDEQIASLGRRCSEVIGSDHTAKSGVVTQRVQVATACRAHAVGSGVDG